MKKLKSISGQEVLQKLSPGYFWNATLENEISIIEMDPYELLSPSRFDLMAKYIYAKFRELNLNSKWGEELYDEHIRVWNGFYEPDGSKYGIEAFRTAFHTVLDSVKNGGFDENLSLVPLGANDIPSDGGHRIAACLLYQKPVAVAKIDKRNARYDYQCFLDLGLSRKYCDAMALEYCRLKKNTYIVVVYPSATGEDEKMKEILGKYGQIFYEKTVQVCTQGQPLLIKQLYSGEKWLGDWDDHFAGAKEKADLCFQQQGPIRLYAFECESLEDVRKAKWELRDLFQIGHHSVHINDTNEETIRLAKLFFNENSLHFLNHAVLNEASKEFYQLFAEYQTLLEERATDPDLYCIDGGSVLGAYGIRETGDLDVLHYDSFQIFAGNSNIESHHGQLVFHRKEKDDIIFNPDNHFYYEGLKFTALPILKEMKQKRGEAKDRRDIALIDAILE